MTEIRFTRDYRGKLTQERFYTAGAVVGFDHDTAVSIVAENAAEFVEPEIDGVEPEATDDAVEQAEKAPATRKRTTKRTKR